MWIIYEPVEGDSRILGLAIYGVDAVDLNSGWDGFDERRYLADQVRAFRNCPSFRYPQRWTSASCVLIA